MNHVVGLIGKVCAGKSTISGIFKDRGAFVYNADKAIHLLYTEHEVKEQVLAKFGLSVFHETEVNRKILANIVFENPAKMQELTDIVYPRIKLQIDELVSQFKQMSQEMLVLDVPLLMKSNMDGCCDKILYITANDKRRQEWAINNRGWTTADLLRRDVLISGPIIRKHDTITNDGTIEELTEKIDSLLESWKREEIDASKTWSIKRRDEMGNEFLVSSGMNKKKAEGTVLSLEIKGYGHKYFIEEENASTPDVTVGP